MQCDINLLRKVILSFQFRIPAGCGCIGRPKLLGPSSFAVNGVPPLSTASQRTLGFAKNGSSLSA